MRKIRAPSFSREAKQETSKRSVELKKKNWGTGSGAPSKASFVYADRGSSKHPRYATYMYLIWVASYLVCFEGVNQAAHLFAPHHDAQLPRQEVPQLPSKTRDSSTVVVPRYKKRCSLAIFRVRASFSDRFSTLSTLKLLDFAVVLKR